MAQYWVGPSLRQNRVSRWVVEQRPFTGYVSRPRAATAPPLTPRRLRALLRLTRLKLQDVAFLCRQASHVVVLLMAAAVGVMNGVELNHYLEPAPVLAAVEPVSGSLWQSTSAERPLTLQWSAIPQTIIPERPALVRYEPITYEVQPGDNPTIIAARFGLQPSTIVWANVSATENPDLLSTGQRLVIPPVDGVLHTVKSGDTIDGLAATFGVEVSEIVAFPGNGLESEASVLVVGQQLTLPGGERPLERPRPAPAAVAAASSSSSSTSTSSQSRSTTSTATGGYLGATGAFLWPARGRITQYSSSWHTAIDIAAPTGTPVYASDGGRVVAAGWDSTGYGWHVRINHGNGFTTLYAHFSVYNVDVGDYVNKGTLIGRIGSTGNSTGPHLHFEVRRNGVRNNPMGYLP